MAKRTKKPRETNALARPVVDQATTESKPGPSTKNACRRRAGGLKGRRGRVAKLTKQQRSEVAKKAARVRWGQRS